MFKQMTTLVAATVFSLFLLSGSAYAYATLDDYILNFSSAAEELGDNTISDVENVAEWQTRGRTFVGFDDNDESGSISDGDTFDNYFAIRVSEIQDSDGNSIGPGSYGNSQDSTHEMTIFGHATGYQDADNSFTLDSLPRLDIYFDAGDNFTQADFGDLTTFDDGLRVETATDGLIKGFGQNAEEGEVSGTFDLYADLQDEMYSTTGEYFELDKNGNALPMELIIGVADSNTDEDDEYKAGPFEEYYGFDADQDWDFFATADADGSINKQVVPEPATMLLFGTGLLGLGFFGRRKFMNMNKKA